MGKKGGLKRKRCNLVEVEKSLNEQHQLSIGPTQPRNQSLQEPAQHRNQPPNNPWNPWLPGYEDQQINYNDYPCWHWQYPKTYQGRYVTDPWSHYHAPNVPHQYPTPAPYYQRNIDVALQSQSKAPDTGTNRLPKEPFSTLRGCQKSHPIPSYYEQNVPVASYPQRKAPIGPRRKHSTNSSGHLTGISDGTNFSNDTSSTLITDAAVSSSVDVDSTSIAGTKKALKGPLSSLRGCGKSQPLLSYSTQNVSVSSHWSKAPVGKASKRCVNGSGHLAAISVYSDSRMRSSNDTNSTVIPNSTSSNDTASFSNASIKRMLNEPSSSLRTVMMNEDGGLLVKVGSNDKHQPEEADVCYLYSVGSNDGSLVELVDLSEDIDSSENQDLSAPELKNSCFTNSSSQASVIIPVIDLTLNSSNKKKKGYTQNTSEKPGAAFCNICDKSFEELHNNKCDLYYAGCGHMFCLLCIKRLKMKNKCIKCNFTILTLRKINF